jgi:hypothetical protein
VNESRSEENLTSRKKKRMRKGRVILRIKLKSEKKGNVGK